jgi:hypothetical protein
MIWYYMIWYDVMWCDMIWYVYLSPNWDLDGFKIIKSKHGLGISFTWVSPTDSGFTSKIAIRKNDVLISSLFRGIAFSNKPKASKKVEKLINFRSLLSARDSGDHFGQAVPLHCCNASKRLVRKGLCMSGGCLVASFQGLRTVIQPWEGWLSISQAFEQHGQSQSTHVGWTANCCGQAVSVQVFRIAQCSSTVPFSPAHMWWTVLPTFSGLVSLAFGSVGCTSFENCHPTRMLFPLNMWRWFPIYIYTQIDALLN